MSRNKKILSKSVPNPTDSGCARGDHGIAVRAVKDQMIAEIDRASLFLKALSGRSRLLLLCHLWDGEKSVGELARLTGARDTAVSQQLALLRREGMVAARRSGQMIFYSLASAEAKRMLESLHALFCAEAPVEAAA
jgi:ArsR family transcriptional regulator, virulence genes transcriptional regulator